MIEGRTKVREGLGYSDASSLFKIMVCLHVYDATGVTDALKDEILSV